MTTLFLLLLFRLHPFGTPLLLRFRRPRHQGNGVISGFHLYARLYKKLKRLILPSRKGGGLSFGSEAGDSSLEPPAHLHEARSCTDISSLEVASSPPVPPTTHHQSTMPRTISQSGPMIVEGTNYEPENVHANTNMMTPVATKVPPSSTKRSASRGSDGDIHELQPTSITDEEVCGGSAPRPWGFRLRHVTPTGTACSRCHWIKVKSIIMDCNIKSNQ